MLWQWLWDRCRDETDNAWWLDFITTFWAGFGIVMLCGVAYAFYEGASTLLTVFVPWH